MLENAIREIDRGIAAGADRGRRERLLRELIRTIDGLLFELEELNLRGRDRVPSGLRERALQALLDVPGGGALEVRHRTIPLMEVLYEAQDQLFDLVIPDRPAAEAEEAATA